jgi:hypothetical protein
MVNQAQKEKILLKTLKNSVSTLSPADDPFGDVKLFSEQVTAYFLAEKAPITIDHKKKSRFRVLVHTKMFGGTAKHLDITEYEKQKASFNIS